MSYRNPNQIPNPSYGAIAAKTVGNLTDMLNKKEDRERQSQEYINKQILQEKIRNEKRQAELQNEKYNFNKDLNSGIFSDKNVNSTYLNSQFAITGAKAIDDASLIGSDGVVSNQQRKNKVNLSQMSSNFEQFITNQAAVYQYIEKGNNGKPLTPSNAPGGLSLYQNQALFYRMKKLSSADAKQNDIKAGFVTNISGNINPQISVKLEGDGYLEIGSELMSSLAKNPGAAFPRVPQWDKQSSKFIESLINTPEGERLSDFMQIDTGFERDSSGRPIRMTITRSLNTEILKDRNTKAGFTYYNEQLAYVKSLSPNKSKSPFAQNDLWNSLQDYKDDKLFNSSYSDKNINPKTSMSTRDSKLNYVNSRVPLTSDQEEELARLLVEVGTDYISSNFTTTGSMNSTATQIFKEGEKGDDYSVNLTNVQNFSDKLYDALGSRNDSDKGFFLNKKLSGRDIREVKFPNPLLIGKNGKRLDTDLVIGINAGYSSSEGEKSENILQYRFDVTNPEQMRLLAIDLYKSDIGKKLSDGDYKALMEVFNTPKGITLEKNEVFGDPNQVNTSEDESPLGENNITYSSTAMDLINNVS